MMHHRVEFAPHTRRAVDAPHRRTRLWSVAFLVVLSVVALVAYAAGRIDHTPPQTVGADAAESAQGACDALEPGRTDRKRERDPANSASSRGQEVGSSSNHSATIAQKAVQPNAAASLADAAAQAERKALSEAKPAASALDPEAKAESNATHNAQPSFDDAPLKDVLLWYQSELGLGFLLAAGALQDDAGLPVRVSLMPPAESNQRELIVLLFEALRSVGRVAMPISGVGESTTTFNLLRVQDAIGYGVIALELAELEGYYFGSLTLEAKLGSVGELRSAVEPTLGPYGKVVALPRSSKLIVSDFIDHLQAASEAAQAVNHPAARADDQVHQVYRPQRHDADALRRAVLSAKSEDESFEISLFASAGTLLITGLRADVERAVSRLAVLDARLRLAEEQISLHEYVVRARPLFEIEVALRDYFRRELDRGEMRLTIFQPRKQVLIECSARRFREAMKLLEEIDRTPRNRAEAVREAEYDEAGPEPRDPATLRTRTEPASEEAPSNEGPSDGVPSEEEAADAESASGVASEAESEPASEADPASQGPSDPSADDPSPEDAARPDDATNDAVSDADADAEADPAAQSEGHAAGSDEE